MTNKEFFIKTLASEMPIFEKVIKAVPTGKEDFKVHEKARTAKSIMSQLAIQPKFISQIINTGLIDFGASYSEPDQAPAALPDELNKNYEQLKKDLAALSDEEWENGDFKMIWPGGSMESKKYDMAWGFLFDAIHHRGQLTSYIRIMDGKVPGIYGGSADEPMSA